VESITTGTQRLDIIMVRLIMQGLGIITVRLTMQGLGIITVRLTNHNPEHRFWTPPSRQCLQRRDMMP
jgi:hypothetical protein